MVPPFLIYMGVFLLYRQKIWIIRRKISNQFFKLIFSLVDILMKRRGYILKLNGLKSRFYLPYIKSDLIQQQIYWKKDYFEEKELNKVCKQYGNGKIGKLIRNSIVLDIGTNIGNHTLYFLNECEAKLVYCFEPIKDTFHVLEENIKINHLESRVVPMNVAVGKNSGKARVGYYTKDNTGMTTLDLSSDGDIKVVSIDELGIPKKIGLVKIDVEGFEVDVIRGMMVTIQRDTPFLFIEIQNTNFDIVNSMLQEFGYQYEILDEQWNYKNYLFYVS